MGANLLVRQVGADLTYKLLSTRSRSAVTSNSRDEARGDYVHFGAVSAWRLMFDGRKADHHS